MLFPCLHNVFKITLIFKKNGFNLKPVLSEVSCFHGYGQELVLSLLIILKLEETITKSDRSKEI